MDKFKKIEKKIQSFNLEEAESMLLDLEVQSPKEKRYINHLMARIYLYKEEYEECISICSEILEEYGPHVGILSDLASALYMIGDYPRHKNIVKKLELEAGKAENKLSLSSYIKTHVCIGKFYEELGMIYEALKKYLKILGRVGEGDANYPMILAQIVRLKPQWGILTGLNEEYHNLFMLNEKYYSENFQIELQHALFVAELELFGIEIALERYHKCKEVIEEDDRRLFLFDLMEFSLRKGFEIPKEIEKLFPHQDLDLYESALLRLYIKEEIDLQQLKGRMPPSGLLRIIALVINCGLTKEIDALTKQYLMLLGSYGESTKKLWKELLKPIDDKEINLIINQNEFTIEHNQRSYNYKRKSNSKLLIKLLIQKQSWSLDEAIKELWDCEYEESYYHRLRMAVKRFNKELYSSLYIDDMIAIDSETLKLRDGFLLSTK